MSEPKWTPGRWVVDYGNTEGHIKSVPDGKEIGDRVATPTVAIYEIDLPQKNKKEQKANAYLMAASKDLYRRLDAATKFMIAERDCYFESISLGDGSIPDDAERAELARLDTEIDANRKALAKARGEA